MRKSLTRLTGGRDEMDVTLSLKPLAYPLYLEPGFSTDTLSTIGEAATFIKALGIEYDRKLHWSFAGTCLVDATRRLDSWDAIRTATEAMENALKTEGMLRTAR